MQMIVAGMMRRVNGRGAEWQHDATQLHGVLNHYRGDTRIGQHHDASPLYDALEKPATILTFNAHKQLSIVILVACRMVRTVVVGGTHHQLPLTCRMVGTVQVCGTHQQLTHKSHAAWCTHWGRTSSSVATQYTCL